MVHVGGMVVVVPADTVGLGKNGTVGAGVVELGFTQSRHVEGLVQLLDGETGDPVVDAVDL